MIISEDRQNHLAHLVTDGVWEDDIIDFTDDDLALRAAKQAIAEFVKEDEDIDQKARAKVTSLKRNVTEGSPEWDIMYKKYYEEERTKRGQK
ncbi:MAG: DUF507 family protein [Bdellovibrionaceae bacterium]|nr:DUF507 family protein [Pseudobdellovibrionaceae bacterium]